MSRRHPRSTRADTLFPYTPRFRSRPAACAGLGARRRLGRQCALRRGPRRRFHRSGALLRRPGGGDRLHRAAVDLRRLLSSMLPGAAAAAARLRRGPARRLQSLPPAGPYGDLRGTLCADGAGHPAALRLGRGMTETATGSIAGERIGFGIGCAVAGLFGMSVMDACAKFLGDDYAVSQVMLARNGVGAIASLALVPLDRPSVV